MSKKPREGLDRRDFMIASIATVGASAVSARSSGPATAQEIAASTSDAESTAPHRTVYTGDVIDGKKRIREGKQQQKRHRQFQIFHGAVGKFPQGDHAPGLVKGFDDQIVINAQTVRGIHASVGVGDRPERAADALALGCDAASRRSTDVRGDPTGDRSGAASRARARSRARSRAPGQSSSLSPST